ncbi:MAG: HAD-IA family hydrolase [Muribaculaceae bacterium]|nr:HAD-IA family hydrolase [Muribaculaceae bacterium]
MKQKINDALTHYAGRSGAPLSRPVKAVLFDMDGVLYDSMPGHARAWKQMCDENGIDSDPDEFFGYEGMTGAATIDLLFRRQFGRGASEEDARRLYARKSELFKSWGAPEAMPGARAAVGAAVEAGADCVLVTGSGQGSLLERLDSDYDGAFRLRVTAYDVRHGKPHPEPFLTGLAKAGADAWRAVAVDNAPLGVRSASAAGIFTIGVRTGPIPEGALLEAGADIELESMEECTKALVELFRVC